MYSRRASHDKSIIGPCVNSRSVPGFPADRCTVRESEAERSNAEAATHTTKAGPVGDRSAASACKLESPLCQPPHEDT